MEGWSILFTLIRVVELLIFVRVVLSWVMGPYPRNEFARLIYRVTDPILQPIRAVLPDLGPVDISPMVAILLLEILSRVLAQAVYAY